MQPEEMHLTIARKSDTIPATGKDVEIPACCF